MIAVLRTVWQASSSAFSQVMNNINPSWLPISFFFYVFGSFMDVGTTSLALSFAGYGQETNPLMRDVFSYANGVYASLILQLVIVLLVFVLLNVVAHLAAKNEVALRLKILIYSLLFVGTIRLAIGISNAVNILQAAIAARII